MPERKQIAVLLIATKKYKQFIFPLLAQIEKYLLPDYKKDIWLFTDGGSGYGDNVTQIGIPSYGFPEATLLRYEMFNKYSELLSKYSHIYYTDIDMAINDVVGEEILVDGLIAVRHPGFYISDGWGSEGNNPESLSYFPADKRKHYYAGGVQGGKSEYYLAAINSLAKRIEDDRQRGVMAIYHDETHWNKWVNFDRPDLITEFTPSYCMVEQEHFRKEWGIDNLPVKIIALAKDHASIRE